MSNICTLVLASVLCSDHSGCDEQVLVLPNDCCPCAGDVSGPRYAAQPGDIVLFRYHKKMTQVLYKLFRAGEITHVAIVVRRPNGSLALLDAPGMRYPVMLNDLRSRLQMYKGNLWVRRQHCPLSPQQSECLTMFACAQDGKKFHRIGLLIPTFGLPRRPLRLRCTGPAVLNADRWFCSSLTVSAGVAAGLIDPCKVRPRFTSPQDLFTDRSLNLSTRWQRPIRLMRCGPGESGWWSEDCCGRRQWRE